jgi:hypothetical protein
VGAAYSDVRGILPVQPEYADVFEDVVLNGKIVFYEKGFIFVDIKVHAIAMPYDHVSEMNFYVTDGEWWLEVTTCENEKSNLYV